MVALNFKAEFAEAVATGRKTQTIRKTARCKPGDTLQLYTGQRTRQCRKLRDAVCLSVERFSVSDNSMYVGNDQLGPSLQTALAKKDGFDTAGQMRKFFSDQYGLPFGGYLITWGLAPSNAGEG